MNSKSHQLVTKKVRKDIESVLEFIDDQDQGQIMFSGLGYSLYFLGVYRIIFNENYELESCSDEQIWWINQILNSDKNKEWKIKEEDF